MVLLTHWTGGVALANSAVANMVSLFILVFAVSALVRFGISQWRAIWISTANQPLSESLRLTAGIDAASIGAGDFGSLLDLCNELSPELRKTSPWLKEVSLYYRSVATLERAFRTQFPSFSKWANGEMQICSRYVAVALDQSIAMNLDRQFAARAS
jgi:hypothetical protein